MEGRAHPPPGDARYSRNPGDHLGFLISWCRESHRKNRFRKWSHDELLAESYLQAHRLLETTFDPTRSTVVTFLKAFLWGAVHYAYWKSQGYRFTDDSVVPKLPLTNSVDCDYIAVEDHVVRRQDMPDLTDEEWIIVRMRFDGYTMTQIASVLGLKSPQSVYNRLVKIRGKFLAGDSDAPGNDANAAAHRPRKKRQDLP